MGQRDAATDKPLPEPRRHHYVPRFLLKGFAVERKRGQFQTQVFDKQTGRTYAASVNDVMVEGDFNAVETPKGRVSLEAAVGDVEAKAAPIIEAVKRTEALKDLSADDRKVLAAFAALQFVRGTGHRAMAVAAAEALNDRIVALGAEAAIDIRPDEGKRFGLMAIAKDLGEYAEHFATKDLLLFRAPKGSNFLLGDNPVALDNEEPADFFGNLGLASEGIQIGLPLSHRLQLNFWCPTLVAKAAADRDAAARKIQTIRAAALLSPAGLSPLGKATLATAERGLARVEALLAHHASGEALELAPEHVVRANSLQIAHAERYVVSPRGDFALAAEMLADNPGFKKGRRLRVS